MNLEEMRKQIDDVDARIVALIAERIHIAEEIGLSKKATNRVVEDLQRERLVLEQVRALARKGNMRAEDAEAIYRQIFAASKRVQGIEVAFQGEVGAYTEEAAFRFFGDGVASRPLESLEDVFHLVETGEVPYAVVPVENSLEGIISRVYDLMLDSKLMVCGETEVRIIHCLIGTASASLDSIRRVYSHPQALAQSRAFLKHLNAELIPTYNTAASVKMIKEQARPENAAVASARAADIYGMKIISREIEDNPNNFTRFFVLAREDVAPSGNDKTSVVFSTKDAPGALFTAVSEFSSRNINLSKLESRPTRQKPWEYNFYLDFQGHREDAAAKEALAGLEKTSIFVKVLGSYPRAR